MGKWSKINKARARRAPGAMNDTEKAWAVQLEVQKLAGEILWWEYEPMKLRVAPKLGWYSPDFAVVFPDFTISMDEIKGSMGWSMDGTGRAKFMDAVDRYPLFRFRKAQKRTKKQGGGLDVKEYEPRKPFPLVSR